MKRFIKFGFMATMLLSRALPSGSELQGPTGTLLWEIIETDDGIRIEGSSPKWTVVHHADSDLRPQRTERTDEDGSTVRIVYEDGYAVIGDKRVRRKNLWDGDTLDVRLGYELINGSAEHTFHVVDPDTAKVYEMKSKVVGSTTCGDVTCTHVRVHLTGVLKPVGPKWDYWLGQDGALLRFDGPAGTFQ